MQIEWKRGARYPDQTVAEIGPIHFICTDGGVDGSSATVYIDVGTEDVFPDVPLRSGLGLCLGREFKTIGDAREACRQKAIELVGKFLTGLLFASHVEPASVARVIPIDIEAARDAAAEAVDAAEYAYGDR